MKLLFASDIHGSSKYAKILKDIFESEKAEKLILLGDYLYHGPRNDLPDGYNPKETLSILNGMKDSLFCVRGNCDGEVDQMVLDFPMMADYAMLYLNGKRVYITHGHNFNPENPLKMQKGDILINGHTHVWKAQEFDEFTYLNPGSVTLPKENQNHSYMVYEDGIFTIKSIDGEILATKKI
ncbi:MAG: phosphodiesterase [Clostridia bacterium]|nr:phosphodiesterase [Clostridia bacterium]